MIEPRKLGAAGLALAAAALLMRRAKGFPMIHDITTDTERPPAFVKILELRRGAMNPAEYGGDAVAAKQKAAYPDLVPAELSLPPEQAFDRALGAARSLGWAVVDADPAAGRIEATDTTALFGFKDDVVIRVAASPVGSRVDARSVSRLGKGDLGANAARLRRFLAALKTPGS